MKLSKSIETLLLEQIQKELDSSYLYLGMSAWFFSETCFDGFADWMYEQSKEEYSHAMKIFHYIQERGNAIHLLPISAPSCTYTSALEVFTKTLEHERYVTQSIYTIYAAALQEKDFATMEFLNWFIKEQVEEESTAEHFVQKLTLAQQHPGALMALNSAAKTRKS